MPLHKALIQHQPQEVITALLNEDRSNDIDLNETEITSFLTLAAQEKKSDQVQKLITIAQKFHASFNPNDVVISINEENVTRLIAAFDCKDYVALDDVLSTDDGYELLYQALQQEKMDLAMLLAIGLFFDFYNIALLLTSHPPIFQRFITLLGGSQSLLYQVINRFICLDVKIPKADLDLFNALASRTFDIIPKAKRIKDR